MLQTPGDLEAAVSGNEIVFRDGTGTLLRYGGVRSWDATGRDLPSRLTVAHRQIRLQVDDAGVRYPVTVDPFIQSVELTDPAGAGGDQFGTSVALSSDGSTALIGAPVKNQYQGAAYAFTLSGGTWSEPQKLIASDGTGFGNVVALSNDGMKALIAAPYQNILEGGAYLFTFSGGTRSQLEELTASDGKVNDGDGDYFGFAVALSSEGTALIGAYGKDDSAGAAYTFSIKDVSVLSAPAGRSFTLSGPGCPSGTLIAPYAGWWTGPCTVTWTSPDASGGTSLHVPELGRRGHQ